jgi:hypothetical protein
MSEDRGGVDIAAAAQALGISTTAVRRRIQRQTLRAYKADDGTWRVVLPAAPSPDGTDRPEGRPEGRPEDVSAVIEILREQLVEKDRQLAAREREISELHVMLQTAQRLIPANVPEAVEPRERVQNESPVSSENASPGGVGRENQPSPRRRGWLSRWFGAE